MCVLKINYSTYVRHGNCSAEAVPSGAEQPGFRPAVSSPTSCRFLLHSPSSPLLSPSKCIFMKWRFYRWSYNAWLYTTEAWDALCIDNVIPYLLFTKSEGKNWYLALILYFFSPALFSHGSALPEAGLPGACCHGHASAWKCYVATARNCWELPAVFLACVCALSAFSCRC